MKRGEYCCLFKIDEYLDIIGERSELLELHGKGLVYVERLTLKSSGSSRKYSAYFLALLFTNFS